MNQRYLQLAQRANYTASIIGNPETQKYILLDARQPAPPTTSETARLFCVYRMRYLGVVGIVNGVPRVELGEPLDDSNRSEQAQSIEHRVQRQVALAHCSVSSAIRKFRGRAIRNV